ncbi:MAG: hypothetical protein AAGJ35_11190, partial [Myxococcota bacterium]
GFYRAHFDFTTETLDVEHRSDYLHRPFLTLFFACDPYPTPEALQEALCMEMEQQIPQSIRDIRQRWPEDLPMPAPILHVYLTGTLGFPYGKMHHLEHVKTWQEQLGLEHIRFSNDTTPLEYVADDQYPRDANGQLDREQLEVQIFQHLLLQDTRYRPHADSLAVWTQTLKNKLLEQNRPLQDPKAQERLVHQICSLLQDTPTESQQTPDAQRSVERHTSNPLAQSTSQTSTEALEPEICEEPI